MNIHSLLTPAADHRVAATTVQVSTYYHEAVGRLEDLLRGRGDRQLVGILPGIKIEQPPGHCVELDALLAHVLQKSLYYGVSDQMLWLDDANALWAVLLLCPAAAIPPAVRDVAFRDSHAVEFIMSLDKSSADDRVVGLYHFKGGAWCYGAVRYHLGDDGRVTSVDECVWGDPAWDSVLAVDIETMGLTDPTTATD